ncbi:hypothetical protein MKX01_031782 [Papaver californicum]|nr:hypothetical protein MKX01_031782 [Papaver californicum]
MPLSIFLVISPIWSCSALTVLVHKAQDVATKRGKLLTDDFLHLIRKDISKLHRCQELFSMNEELKQVRKAFAVDEKKLASTD